MSQVAAAHLKQDQNFLNLLSQTRMLKKSRVEQVQAPPSFEVTQELLNGPKRNFPDVGFNIVNPNNFPIRVKVLVKTFLGRKNLGISHGHYSGERIWNINPSTRIFGHFQVDEKTLKSKENIRLEVTVAHIDQNNK